MKIHLKARPAQSVFDLRLIHFPRGADRGLECSSLPPCHLRAQAPAKWIRPGGRVTFCQIFASSPGR